MQSFDNIMNSYFLFRCLGIAAMLSGSILLCIVPFEKLSNLKKELTKLVGDEVTNSGLFWYVFMPNECSQIVWSQWGSCFGKVPQASRFRQLPYAKCREVVEYKTCSCPEEPSKTWTVTKKSYMNLGCLRDENITLEVIHTPYTMKYIRVKSYMPAAVIKKCKSARRKREIVMSGTWIHRNADISDNYLSEYLNNSFV